MEGNSSRLHDGPCRVACAADETATELLTSQRVNVNAGVPRSVNVNVGMERRVHLTFVESRHETGFPLRNVWLVFVRLFLAVFQVDLEYLRTPKVWKHGINALRMVFQFSLKNNSTNKLFSLKNVLTFEKKL